MKRKIIAVLGFVLGTGSASAATIEVVPLKGKLFKSVITVTGRMDAGDEKTFRAKLASAPQPAIVAFNSPGGALAAGLGIGEQIQAAKLRTFVPEMMKCSSACALAWVAGDLRYMQGKVGFHAAFNSPENHAVSSTGNAYVGAYLSKLGMSYSAIIYMTKAPPSSMEWLTKPEAMKFGVDFSTDDPTTFVEAAPAPAPPAVASTTRWLTSDDLIKATAARAPAPAPVAATAPVRPIAAGAAAARSLSLPTWSLGPSGKFDRAAP